MLLLGTTKSPGACIAGAGRTSEADVLLDCCEESSAGASWPGPEARGERLVQRQHRPQLDIGRAAVTAKHEANLYLALVVGGDLAGCYESLDQGRGPCPLL